MARYRNTFDGSLEDVASPTLLKPPDLKVKVPIADVRVRRKTYFKLDHGIISWALSVIFSYHS